MKTIAYLATFINKLHNVAYFSWRVYPDNGWLIPD